MDVIALRRATSAASVPLTSPFDLNRDGKINALDLSALRTNLSRTLRPLIAPAAPQAAIAAIAPGPSQGTESAIRRVWEEPISDPLGRSQ